MMILLHGVLFGQEPFKVTNLQIVNTTHPDQCATRNPRFSWDYSAAAEKYDVDVKIYEHTKHRDSLIFRSRIKDTPARSLTSRLHNKYQDGQTYFFIIKAKHPDRGWSQSDTVEFTMNTPPEPPVFYHQQEQVFREDSLTFYFSSSADRQVAGEKIGYKLKIINLQQNSIVFDKIHYPVGHEIDTIDFTFVNQLQENGRFLALVRAYDNVAFSAQDSLVFYVNRRNDPPEEFNLISRDDTLTTEQVSLNWERASDPEEEFGGAIAAYHLKIALDSSFQRIVEEKKLKPKNTAYKYKRAENHRHYFWQVIATDNHGATTISNQRGHFVINIGNHIPPEPNLVSPLNREIMKPGDYLIWQQPEDKDQYDPFSYRIYITNYSAVDTFARFNIENQVLKKARQDDLEWIESNYQNRIKVKLGALLGDPSAIEEGSYYRIILECFDGWGGKSIYDSPQGSFQFDDNINRAPMPPTIGLQPDSSIITSPPVEFGWYPATDPDLNDRVKYKIKISRLKDFSGSNFITYVTEFGQNKISLDRNFVENAKYYWQVKSIDSQNAESDWSQSNNFYINFVNEAPAKAVPCLAPGNWSGFNRNTIFKWKLIEDPDPGDELKYLLEIDNDKYFQSIDLSRIISLQEADIEGQQSIATYQFRNIDTSSTLKENSLYYWRIAAIDRQGLKSPYLRNYPRINFNLENDPPHHVAKFIKKGNDNIVTTRTPLLRWQPAEDPDFTDFSKTLSYTLQLSASPDFSTYNIFTYHTDNGVTSFRIPGPLTENKKWYYRVQTVDSKGSTSSWSPVDSLIINAKSEPPEKVHKGFVLKNNVITDTREPKISWRAVTDNDPHHSSEDLYYLVKYFPAKFLGTSKEDRKSETIKSDVGRTSVILKSLKENTSYCYKVAAVDPEGVRSEWSEPQKFIVNTRQEAPRPFELIWPLNGKDSIETDVQFQWRSSYDPDPQSQVEYTILISTDSLFNQDVIKSSILPGGKDTLNYKPSNPLRSASKYFWKVIAEDQIGMSTQVPAGEGNSYMFTTIGFREHLNVSKKSMLLQNSPNPFNVETQITYHVGSYTDVKIMIFNVLGEKVKVLVNDKKKAGRYQISWDGTNQEGRPVPGGMYFCRMYTRKNSDLVKMVLLR